MIDARVGELEKWQREAEHTLFEAGKVTGAVAKERDALARALEAARGFLKSVAHIHNHSGAMNATQLGRRDHFERTVATVDGALAQARANACPDAPPMGETT